MAEAPFRGGRPLRMTPRTLMQGLLLAGLAIGTLGLFNAAWPGSAGRVVEAERFVLKDTSARVRVELTVLEDGSPTLGLFDRNGVPRALLGLAPDGTPGPGSPGT
jgi:hypothetical protein